MTDRPRSWGGWMARSFGESRLPAELAAPIATTNDGRDITRPWVRDLEQARDPRLLTAADWGVYDRVLMDDQVKSCIEQRIRAVVSRDWDVLPGDEDDPRSVECAERFTDQLKYIGWDRTTEKMLYAPFHGYSVAELLWEPRDGLMQWSQLRVRHARRFRFDIDGRLRLLTRASRVGEILPDRKFWVVTSGGSDDDEPYGRGLAEWLYWPTLFKRNGIRFWNIFLDKFSVPTAKGTYPRGSTVADIEKLLGAIQAIAVDSGFVVPEGMQVELLQLAQTGADFAAVCRYMDGAIAKIILSQTMTTDNGSSRSQSETHADVKLEVVKADADLLSDSFNTGPARWWTDLNYGPDVASPVVVRIVEAEDDLKEAADTDEVLARTGWVRTEESFKDRYGDGYEAKAPIDEPGKPDAVGKPTAQPGNDNVVPLRIAALAASDPKPLYVYRQVKNASEIVAWAKEQGFTSLLAAGDLHVTVMYSKRPVNWFDMASDFVLGDRLEIASGGPRVVDRLGDAVVLHFASQDLAWRNRQMRDAGASWDYPQYLAHISLTYQPGDIDLTKIVPYAGRIVLGPEVFEPIEHDWDDEVAEVSLAEPAPPRDVVDDAVDALMADDGWRAAFGPLVDPLVEQLRTATSREDVLAILSREADLAGEAALTESLARAGFATRIDALTDDGGEG